MIHALTLQVSVGTLLAFTMVAVSVLILRYVPPNEVPLPPSLQEAIDSVSLRYNSVAQEIDVVTIKNQVRKHGEDAPLIHGTMAAPADHPLIQKEESQGNYGFLYFVLSRLDSK